MPENNVVRTLKQTRADLVEALDDLQAQNLIDFESSINRQRKPNKGKHIKITVEYITQAEK